MMLEEIESVLRFRPTGRLRLEIVVEDEEETGGSDHDFRVVVHDTARPDSIHRFLVVPDLALVELDHHDKGASGTILVRVLKKTQDKVLHLLVDVLVLCLLVKVFHVLDDGTVEELAKLFVLAAEELEENRQYNCG